MERKTDRGHFQDSSEAISFQKCLRVYTMGGVWTAFDEGEPGGLEPGKPADFVIWNTVAKKTHSLCFFYHSCQPDVLKIFHSPLLPISVKEISPGSSGHLTFVIRGRIPWHG